MAVIHSMMALSLKFRKPDNRFFAFHLELQFHSAEANQLQL